MFRVFNEYLSRVRITTDDLLRESMESFLDSDEQIAKSSINMNYNKYVVDIVLDEFTVDYADGCFRKFVSAVAYPYSSLWVRYNEGSRVCYRFITSKENKSAIYMNIILS